MTMRTRDVAALANTRAGGDDAGTEEAEARAEVHQQSVVARTALSSAIHGAIILGSAHINQMRGSLCAVVSHRTKLR
jgi:hypothetical protein